MLKKQRTIMRNWLLKLFKKISFFAAVPLFLLLNNHLLSAKTILVGTNLPNKNLSDVVSLAVPGDTIRFQKGVYPGGQIISGLKVSTPSSTTLSFMRIEILLWLKKSWTRKRRCFR